MSQLIKKLNRSSVNSFKAIKEMVWESEFAGWEKYAKLELDLQKSLAFTEDLKKVYVLIVNVAALNSKENKLVFRN